MCAGIICVARDLTSLSGSGKVYEGTWNRTEVALKVLKTVSGGSPSAAVSICRISASLSVLT